MRSATGGDAVSAAPSAVDMRLRRVEGQAAGIARMLRDGRPCVEILDQIGAARAGLEAVALLVLKENIRALIREGVAAQDVDHASVRVIESVIRLARNHLSHRGQDVTHAPRPPS